MRDVRKFTEKVQAFYTNPGTESPVFSGVQATHVITDSARGDVVETVPNSTGAYYRPTNYRGWYYSSTAHQYDYYGAVSESELYPARHYTGRMTWSQYSPGMNTSTLYGLTSSKRPDLPAGLLNRMESQLQARLASQSWDVGQFLAELPQTVGFVIESIKDMITILKALKAGVFKGVSRAFAASPPTSSSLPFPGNWDIELFKGSNGVWSARSTISRAARVRRAILSARNAKTASNAYLATMYGLMPIIMDVQASLELLHNGLSSNDVGPVEESVTVEEPMTAPALASGTYDLGSQFSGKYEVTGFVRYKVTRPTLMSLEELGLLSPLSLAWELFPLSFVIDWFVPVGRFLSALSGHWGLTFDYGYRTTYAGWNADVRFSKAYAFRGGTPVRITGTLKAFDREIYLGFPLPVPYLRGLDLSLLRGYLQSVSILALGVQRVLR